MANLKPSYLNTIILAIGLMIGLILVLWVMCILDDITGWDINDPPWCGETWTPPNDNGEGNGETACPPINTKMRTELPAIIAEGATVCITGGGTFYDQSGIIGCHDPAGGIDCLALELSTNYQTWWTTCVQQSGIPICTPALVACYCPGDIPLPSYDCGWIKDLDYGLRCDGGCPTNSDCEQFGTECVCKGNCGFHLDEGEEEPACWGECPVGEICDVSGDIDEPECECVPDILI